MKLKGKLAILGLLALVALFTLIGPATANSDVHLLGCKPSSKEVLQKHYNSKYINSLQSKASSAAVDWSAGMPTPGDQGQQGSCVAWSVGYNYKSYQEQQERNWGLGTNSHLFSPAYIYNQIDGGQDNGSSIADAMNLLVSQGCDTLDDMPYNDQDYTTQPTQAQKQRAAQFKELSWTPLFQGTANINAMKSALTNGPIEAGTDVYWSAGWQTTGNISQSGVFGSSNGGHAIVIVGYDDNHQTNDGAGAFKFINSWSTNWGNYGGYGWVSYSYVQHNFFEAEVMYDQAPTNNTYSVSGTVSDQNQQPVSGVTMTFSVVSGSGTLPAAVSTNTSGNWSQSGFVSGTTYRVTPSKTNYTFTPASQNFDGTQGTVFNFTANSTAPTAGISVTAPAGGENWQTGSSHTISWSYTGNPGSAVELDLLKGGSVASTITASTSVGSNGSGSYSWTIPSGQAAGTNYQVRITGNGTPAVTSTSGTFAISAPAPGASIRVTAPAGGENWQPGSAHTIAWSYTGNPGSTVKIELLSGGSASGTITASTSVGSNGSGSYSWTIPSGQAAGTSYQVRITGNGTPAVTSTSKAFTVSAAPAPTSAITLAYPKGGEHWPKGQYYLITWKYTGNPGSSVRIDLLKGSSVYKTIVTSTSIGYKGSGYYSYHISIFQASGSDFRVRITSNSSPSLTSTSGYFSIGY